MDRAHPRMNPELVIRTIKKQAHLSFYSAIAMEITGMLKFKLLKLLVYAFNLASNSIIDRLPPKG